MSYHIISLKNKPKIKYKTERNKIKQKKNKKERGGDGVPQQPILTEEL
jgi:hypothetical protein